MNIKKEQLGKVAVLYGGVSAEREVSIRSGTMVHAALVKQGVDAHLFDTATRDVFDLKKEGFNRVFIALHGRFGEDGTLQGALELMGIPYTGSGVLASALAMNKVRTKQVWLQNGLSTPLYYVLPRGADIAAVQAEIIDTLGLPIFVKPPHEGSSLGASKVETVEQLQAACELSWKYDTHALIEQCVEGRELTCAVLGTGASARALPIVEIKAPSGDYNFHNKYNGNETVYVCPAELSEDLTAQIQTLVLNAYRALDCAGWARADVLLRAVDGKPFLLEMNTSPGMTDHSLVPMAARASGLSYEELVIEILSNARVHVQRQVG
ncbi:D-alanine--D-alanine ligase [Hydromonas duriensis]|uniref:D-alanine--D-alanine ligase n=1 Tax=Hydromonas duriensis TaxID=1527608 RepID=A0A4R6Y5S8_9BURK|nr:D-alanine--D-alanine ligase [Hydromonas duriensis]TDR30839.1 D-alanine--D-alanine ligase [Hydromonas duriensis]